MMQVFVFSTKVKFECSWQQSKSVGTDKQRVRSCLLVLANFN